MCRRLLYLVPFVLLMGLASVSEAQVDDPSLVAWWQLDEGSGTTAGDATGNGNDGTLNAGAAWTAGTSKTGVYLDGVDDYIETPNVLTEIGTIAFWFKPDWDGTDPEDYRLFDASTSAIYFFISKGANHADINPEEFGFYLEDVTDADYQAIEFDPAGVIFADTWHHVAVTWEFGGGSAILYLDGQEMARADNIGGFPPLNPTLRFGYETLTYIPIANGAQAVIDEILIYSRVFAPEEIPLLMITAPAELASAPSPADEATDVPRDLTLGWTPGEFAAGHDVYLGTSADDVNNASRANPLDVLVSQGQGARTYDAGRLELGQTYYWRVDEVNAAPDSTIFTGEVWSFTVEPLAYPIQGIVATSNGDSDAGLGPENTVNGSGLNDDDTHSTVATDMWLALPGGETPVWVLYEFDRVYKLREMQIWNYNVQFEPMLGFGLKNVTVEYSTDGAAWTVLGDVELVQATARSDYLANSIVDFDGQAVRYVKLTINSNYGGLAQYGLSEVRFLQIPTSAREPQPGDGQTNVSPETTFAWRAGREADMHEVYLGTDPNTLALIETVAEPSVTPTTLEFGTRYFWKVNEVNEAETLRAWESGTWTFQTLEFAAIDDFESYDNDENAIYQTWIDGWVNGTGSTAGYLTEPFAETSIVNSGRQSMPLIYDNGASPSYSEIERDLEGLDLDAHGADTLRLFVAGQAPPYLEIDDSTIVMSAIGADIWNAADEFRYAYMNLSGDGSIVARVDGLYRSNEWVKGGVMIRESLEAGSTFAAVYLTADYGVRYQARLETDASAVSDSDVVTDDQVAQEAPVWVKIERVGNAFNGYYSTDGENWTSMVWSPQTIAMAGDVTIGLALTSHDSSISTGAALSGIATTGNVSGGWQTAEIGVAQPTDAGNSIEPLYVALEDSAGNVAVVTNPNAAAAGNPAWQEWLIPYSDLAGINLNNVSTVYIGVGDRDNPAAGGTGTIFVDDIGFGRPVPTTTVQTVASQ